MGITACLIWQACQQSFIFCAMPGDLC